MFAVTKIFFPRTTQNPSGAYKIFSKEGISINYLFETKVLLLLCLEISKSAFQIALALFAQSLLLLFFFSNLQFHKNIFSPRKPLPSGAICVSVFWGLK